MRFQLDVPILAHEKLAEFEYELTLFAPEVANHSKPGQFMQILYDNSYNPFTRRPFSVYKVDKAKGTFSIVYLARGVFTQGLRNKQVGQKLSVVGPLGNWFSKSGPRETTHILVGGGVGAPPLCFFAEELVADSQTKPLVRVINGARSKDLLVGIHDFDILGLEVAYTTNDGSYGQKGVVTNALADILDSLTGPAHVYTCGPTAMLRAVGDLCMERGVPCQVSVETMMPCGRGVCMGCVVKIKDDSESGFNYLRSCFEGPVFPAESVLWE